MIEVFVLEIRKKHDVRCLLWYDRTVTSFLIIFLFHSHCSRVATPIQEFLLSCKTSVKLGRDPS